MNPLRLKKNGILHDGSSDVIPGHGLKHLGRVIQIENDFTLACFFLLFAHYPELKAINEIIDPLLEIAQPHLNTPPEKDPSIDELIFYKIIEIQGVQLPPELVFYNQLKGKTIDGQIDLKFFHIETLLGHHLCLGQLEHIVFGDTQDILRFDTFYTLFEFMEGIAWQLSFNFNPLQCSIRR